MTITLDYAGFVPPKRNIERILSLMMTLSATSQGFTRRQLFDLIPGYEAAKPRSRARQFDRDLEHLADAGITVTHLPDPYEPGTVRYRIPQGEQQVLAVTAEERAVLAAALAAWDSSASSGIGGRVRAKLLSIGIEPGITMSGRTDLSAAPALTALLSAALARRTVGFDYRGGRDNAPQPRHIEPWLVGVVDAIPYVYGYDLDRAAPRLFRISRIANAPRTIRAATTPVPAGLELAKIVHSSSSESVNGTAKLRIHPFKALPLRDRADADPEQTRVTVTLSGDTLHRAVLRESAWVRIEAPTDAAARFLRSLERIEQLHQGHPSLDPEQARNLPARRQRAIRALATGSTDVARLVAIAAYVQHNPGTGVAAIAARFGISQHDLVRDLNLLMMVGDFSSGVSEFVDTAVADGDVLIANAESLSIPLQLTSLDAAALLLGLDMIDADQLALDPGALRSLRATLETIAGRVGAGAEAPTNVSASAPGHTATTGNGGLGRAAHNAAVITAALEAGERVVIRYARPDEAFTTVRSIRPYRIDIAHGHVYVTADCALNDGERRFRTDRIVSAWAGTDPSAPTPTRSDADHPAVSEPVASVMMEAVLKLGPSALWIADAFRGSRLADNPAGEGETVAVVTTVALPALISAVIEADGAAEALAPASLRHAIWEAAFTARRDQERYG